MNLWNVQICLLCNIILDFCFQFGEVIKTCEDSLKPILTKLHHLYLVDIVEKNLGVFIGNGIITPDVATKVSSSIFLSFLFL